MSKKSGNIEDTTNFVAKKRGRKSKKQIEEAQKKSVNETINITENIVVKMEETESTNQSNNSCIDEILNSDNDNDNDNDNQNNENESNNIKISNIDNKPLAKKRGRKPKGGKIIQQIISLTNVKENKPNVILHLKCSLKDLNSSSNLFGLIFIS